MCKYNFIQQTFIYIFAACDFYNQHILQTNLQFQNSEQTYIFIFSQQNSIFSHSTSIWSKGKLKSQVAGQPKLLQPGDRIKHYRLVYLCVFIFIIVIIYVYAGTLMYIMFSTLYVCAVPGQIWGILYSVVRDKGDKHSCYICRVMS